MNDRGYADNLQFLDALHTGLGGETANAPEMVGVSSIPTRSGAHTAEVRIGSENRILLHSAYNPVREAERSAALLPSAGTYVVFGIGAGHLPRAIVASHPGSTVIVCEATLSSLKGACRMTDLQNLIDSRACVLAVGHEELYRTLAVLHLELFRPVIHLWELRPWSQLGCWSRDFDQCRNAVETFRESDRFDRATMAKFGRKWATGIVRSSVLLSKQTNRKKSSVLVRSLVADKVVGVAAAGPGLDENYAQLDRCDTIVAVDTAVPALQTRGMYPQMVVSIDPQPWSYLHLRKPLTNEEVLVADPALPAIVLRKTPNVVMGFGSHPFAKIASASGLPHLSVDTNARNVAGTTYALVQSLGAKEIVVVGGDFRYRLGRAYAKETYLDRLARNTGDRTRSAETFWATFLYDRSDKTTKEEDGFSYSDPLLERYRTDMDQRKDMPYTGPAPEQQYRQVAGNGDVVQFLESHRIGLSHARQNWRQISNGPERTSREMLAELGPHGAAHIPFAYALASRGSARPMEEALVEMGVFMDRVFHRYYT